MFKIEMLDDQGNVTETCEVNVEAQGDDGLFIGCDGCQLFKITVPDGMLLYWWETADGSEHVLCERHMESEVYARLVRSEHDEKCEA